MRTTTQDPAEGLTRFHSWWRRTAPVSDLPTSSLSALDALDVLGPHRVSELAARERLTQPGMTSLVTRLVDEGLVTRAADPSDGRVAVVSITDAGRACLAGVRLARADDLRRRLTHLTDEDRRALAAAIPALTRLTSGDTA
ncbi:MarR family winged helix-turn-helix transcriptional regulator [Rhodococcus aerolatus]